MAKLKPAQIAEVKGKGFLINRGTENFSGRIVPRGTVFSPDDLKTISEISSNNWSNPSMSLCSPGFVLALFSSFARRLYKI